MFCFKTIAARLVPLILFACCNASASAADTWQSALVRIEPDGRLSYTEDAEGNRIPDFSNAGYRGGGVPLPDAPVLKTVGPVSGDNTEHLQAAIDSMVEFPIDPATGIRGALRLKPGLYEVSDTLFIRHSGVVLMGAGQGADPEKDTILRRVGTLRTPVILAGGTDPHDRFSTMVPGTRVEIVTPRVTVGSRSFEVADAGVFSVGDTVVVEHPVTEEWIQAVDGGGAGEQERWRVGDKEAEMTIRYLRRIARIEGNTLTLDAPVFNHLDRSLSVSTVYKYDTTPFLTELGVADLRIVIQTAGEQTEEHARDGVVFRRAMDCWARNVTVLHFSVAGIKFHETFVRGTALECQALEPHSRIVGARRYNFAVERAAQLVLFEKCHASYARHAFISNGSTLDSGIVVLECSNEHSYAAAEGHRRWSHGLLFDGYTTTKPEPMSRGLGILGFYCRGDWGIGHGWAAAHSVAWRCDTAGGALFLQKPPTAQNYAIGCFANINGKVWFPAPSGYIEGTGRPGLVPHSLYRAQLAARLGK